MLWLVNDTGFPINMGFRTHSMCSTVRKMHKLFTVNIALIIIGFVPSSLCNSNNGWSTRLTFDEIYNSTDYAQLQHSRRPYTPQLFNYNQSSYNLPSYNQPSYNQPSYSQPSYNQPSYNQFSNNQPRYNQHDYDHSGHNLNVNSHSNSLEELKGNELEYDFEVPNSENKKEKLLVGFSHDPFRYSIPEDDYLKGVRDMTPSTIMSKSENRGKRGVLQLYNMMFCATGCEPLAYKGYGCYCGFLGSGEPTDGIDRCCMIHDRCYENLFCPVYTVYLQPYLWKCYKGRPLCAAENQRTKNNFINGCAAQLCECDRKFAMCVKKYTCPRRRSLCYSSPLRFLQNLLSFGK